MNSRLDWLVLSDYYSIYVTNAPPKNCGIRTGWKSARKTMPGFQGERADQTTDETVVCNPGVIATKK